MSESRALEVLSPDECLSLLRSESLGRIGIAVRALPVILPVSYTVRDRHLIVRTEPGTKLAAATANAVVAFEVDDIDRATGLGWSVLVQGIASDTLPVPVESVSNDPALARWLDPTNSTYISVELSLVTGRRLTRTGPDDEG